MVDSSPLNVTLPALDTQPFVLPQAPLPSLTPGSNDVSFSAQLGDALREVDRQEREASELMSAVERGDSDDLIGAMLKSQEAGLSFSMMLQIRNKVVAAVDDLTKMQL